MNKLPLSSLLGAALLVPALFFASCSKEQDAVAPASLSTKASADATGNGAPSGSHYNLNIIGVPKGKTADMTGNNGGRIFVNMDSRTKINLADAGVNGDFQVLDANGTDANGATFQLPTPDADGDGVTTYSCYARALGTPGGQAKITTCAVLDGEDVCSLETLTMTRSKGASKFQNVTDELLSIVVDITDDGVDNPVRYPLFSDALQGYYWDYDNNGLKLLQVRFYEMPHTYSAVR